jgi:hypothetical protein
MLLEEYCVIVKSSSVVKYIKLHFSLLKRYSVKANLLKEDSFCGKQKYIINTILNAEAFFPKSDKVTNYQTSAFFPQY